MTLEILYELGAQVTVGLLATIGGHVGTVTSEPESVDMGAPQDEQSVSAAANWWPQAEHFIWMSVMSPQTYAGCGARPMTSVTKYLSHSRLGPAATRVA